MKAVVKFEDFAKLDLRTGKIIACERKEGSDKLLRLTVDFGDEGYKNILSGIYPFYKPEDIVGKQFVFVLNLEPRKIMGEESKGMILCAEGKKPVPLKPQSKVKPGAPIS
jgi:methionyl-tRNA synthetase